LSNELTTRSFTPELEIRSAAKGGDGRTIVGIAVPFGQRQRIDAGLTEQFASGAFDHQLRAANRVRFTRDHMAHGGVLIGTTTSLRNDPAGLVGEWRVSKTPTGEETLELVKDGALRDLSVGFQEVQNRRLEDGTIERVKANLSEVSVVLEGAYGAGATVQEVRAVETLITECPQCGRKENLARAAQIIAGLPVLRSVT
jgi:HK97 family phage prohead protease